MGEEVTAQSYTREQRQRYREKVRQDLDVFERMLAQSSFEFERPMTGLEIELNLVDKDYQPLFANAEVLEEIADPDYQTELARYNIELNVPPRPLPGDAALDLEDELRASLNRADDAAHKTRRPHRGDRHPPDAHAGALRGRVDQRQQPLHGAQRLDLRRPRRGHLPRHRGALGGARGDLLRTRSPPSPPAPASSCTCRWHPQDFAAHWNAAQALVAPAAGARPPTRRSSSASGCTPRPASSCSARPPTPAASS